MIGLQVLCKMAFKMVVGLYLSEPVFSVSLNFTDGCSYVRTYIHFIHRHIHAHTHIHSMDP